MFSRDAFISLLDILFSLFFVGPVTVLYWRGTFVSLFNFFISGITELSVMRDADVVSLRVPRRREMASCPHPIRHRAHHQDPGGPGQALAEGKGGDGCRASSQDRPHLPGLPLLRGDVGGRFLLSLLAVPGRAMVPTAGSPSPLLRHTRHLQSLLLNGRDSTHRLPGTWLFIFCGVLVLLKFTLENIFSSW